MTNGTASAPKHGVSRWLLIVLGLSLALNLFLAGAIGGRAVLGGNASLGTPEEKRLGKQILSSMSESAKPETLAMFKDVGELRRTDRLARAEASISVYDALEAIPFDADAFTGAQFKVLEMRNAHHAAVQARVFELVRTLDSEDRRALAEVLKARSARRIEKFSQRRD